MGEFTTALNYSGRALGCLAVPLAIECLLVLGGESSFLGHVGDRYPIVLTLAAYLFGLGAGLLVARLTFRRYTFWIMLVYVPVALLLMLFTGIGLEGGI